MDGEEKRGERNNFPLERNPFLNIPSCDKPFSFHPFLPSPWRTNTKYAARGRPVSPRLPKRIRKRGIDPSISPHAPYLHSPIAIFDSAERSGLEEILPREFITATNLSTRIQFSRCTRVTRVIPASSRSSFSATTGRKGAKRRIDSPVGAREKNWKQERRGTLR